MKRLHALTSDGVLVECPVDASVVVVDVRDDLRNGREPLSRIMAAVDALGPHTVMHLRATFAPVPLIGILAERGFVYQMEPHADDDWSVWFWRPE